MNRLDALRKFLAELPRNLAALMPAPSKVASISCRLASGVRTRPRLSCLRISPADNKDTEDVIASRLRHLHYLRQVVLRATLTKHFVFHLKDWCNVYD
jgi:hypothetical protein